MGWLQEEGDDCTYQEQAWYQGEHPIPCGAIGNIMLQYSTGEFGKQAATYGGNGEDKAQRDAAIAYDAIIVGFGVTNNAAADEEGPGEQ